MPLSDEERNGLIPVAAVSLRPGLVLKEFQVDCLTSMGKNHMTITSARTGMGKSIVFLVGMKYLQV
jgi:superfamily II DNA or RNA helicase